MDLGTCFYFHLWASVSLPTCARWKIGSPPSFFFFLKKAANIVLEQEFKSGLYDRKTLRNTLDRHSTRTRRTRVPSPAGA